MPKTGGTMKTGMVMLLGVLCAAAVYAAKPVYTSWLSDVAVGGYDAVSYFSESGPVKGKKAITHEYNGTTWQFATAENRDAFIAAPEKYAPQFGGYCAWAAAQNYLAPGDPRYWKLIDGKLYLNYSAMVQADWEKDIPGFIQKADANWPEILKE